MQPAASTPMPLTTTQIHQVKETLDKEVFSKKFFTDLAKVNLQSNEEIYQFLHDSGILEPGSPKKLTAQKVFGPDSDTETEDEDPQASKLPTDYELFGSDSEYDNEDPEPQKRAFAALEDSDPIVESANKKSRAAGDSEDEEDDDLSTITYSYEKEKEDHPLSGLDMTVNLVTELDPDAPGHQYTCSTERGFPRVLTLAQAEMAPHKGGPWNGEVFDVKIESSDWIRDDNGRLSRGKAMWSRRWKMANKHIEEVCTFKATERLPPASRIRVINPFY